MNINYILVKEVFGGGDDDDDIIYHHHQAYVDGNSVTDIISNIQAQT